MTAATIAALLIQYGPGAIDLIEKLVAVWEKPALTLQEVLDITAVAKKSYADYLAEARASVVATAP